MIKPELEDKIRLAASVTGEAGLNIVLRPNEIESLLAEVDELRKRVSELDGKLAQVLDEHELETHCPVCGTDLSMAV